MIPTSPSDLSTRIVSMRSGNKDALDYNNLYSEQQNELFSKIHDAMKPLAKFKKEIDYSIFEKIGKQFAEITDYLSPFERALGLVSLHNEIQKKCNVQDFDNNIIWKQKLYSAIKDNYSMEREEKELYLNVLTKNTKEQSVQNKKISEISEIVKNTDFTNNDSFALLGNQFLSITKQSNFADSKIEFTHLFNEIQINAPK